MADGGEPGGFDGGVALVGDERRIGAGGAGKKNKAEASTLNPGRMQEALHGVLSPFPRPIIVIADGRDRLLDYTPER